MEEPTAPDDGLEFAISDLCSTGLSLRLKAECDEGQILDPAVRGDHEHAASPLGLEECEDVEATVPLSSVTSLTRPAAGPLMTASWEIDEDSSPPGQPGLDCVYIKDEECAVPGQDPPNRGLNDDLRGVSINETVTDPLVVPVSLQISIGSLVWASIAGRPPWPGLVIPDIQTGQFKRPDEEEGSSLDWYVILLEGNDLHRWVPESSLAVLTAGHCTGALKSTSAEPALGNMEKAVTLARCLLPLHPRERITEFIKFRRLQEKAKYLHLGENDGGKELSASPSDWPKLARTPYVRLKKLKTSQDEEEGANALGSGRSSPSITTSHRSCDSSRTDSELIGSSGLNNDSSSGSCLEMSLSWVEGDLVWALVKGYPYWPALVFAEPSSGETVKQHGWESTSVHVVFLNSKKQTAWVKDTNIVTFSQADQFANILLDCPPKVASQFRPTKVMASRYEEAEKTALSLLPLAREDRLDLVFAKDL